MRKTLLTTTFIIIILFGCQTKSSMKYEIAGPQSKIIKEMIDAVNEKDAEKYVDGFAQDVKVFVEADMKVDGRENLKLNRARHFEAHPDVRSAIQHLVEIDNKVILHDKVWLSPTDELGQDIVEIFTFENGQVVKVEVIQPKDLFRN